MGMFDHSKTWRFRLASDPQACVTAFEQGMTNQSSMKLTKTNWTVRRTTSGSGLPAAVATYDGRGGAAAALTSMTRTGSAEESRALGSQVTFEVEEASADGTTCAMWLNAGSRTLGFQNDGRFFRSAMKGIERQLRQLDPSLKVLKS